MIYKKGDNMKEIFTDLLFIAEFWGYLSVLQQFTSCSDRYLPIVLQI